MAWGGWATCRTAGTAGMCAAAQAALCKATARHRQLVLQLGGSADSLRLTGKEGACVLLAGLRQAPVSPKERQELERLWVLFLSALELFLEDLCQAHHFCQLFSVLGGSTAPMHTRLEGWELPSHKRDRRGGDPTQPPSIPRLEEIEQVRAMLVEMESRANIPLWMVEATAGGAVLLPAPKGGRGVSAPGHSPAWFFQSSAACVFRGLSMFGSGHGSCVSRWGGLEPRVPLPSAVLGDTHPATSPSPPP
uniref:Regulator of G-protein signaling 9-binding protein n=1 Tax=Falco tinnunculus TaxID=100819 RepID=A0A8C4TRM8_FALTI